MFLKQVRCQERERRYSYSAATVESYWFKNTNHFTNHLLIILRHSFDIWNFLKLEDVWRKKIKLDRYHLHNHLRSYYVVIQIQFNFPMEIW